MITSYNQVITLLFYRRYSGEEIKLVFRVWINSVNIILFLAKVKDL
jgi:hypothetical protein